MSGSRSPGSCSASDLRRALSAAHRALNERSAELDALNVFPVADADTGTNMAATFQSVVRAAERATTAPEIARAIRSGSLMGARGNSGVIAAQILRAWADAVEAGPADGETVARSFKRAVELAYEAVLEPAEGTILSVLRAASDASQTTDAAQTDDDERAAQERDGAANAAAARFEGAAREAVVALALTRTVNPVLARAGVVDAGGAGLTIALAAIAESLGGAHIDVPPLPAARAWLCEDRPTFAFEVMYSLRAADDAIPPLRRLLGTIGDSVAVVGGAGDWRVHVHTDDRERAIALGEAVGDATDVQVVSFEEQIAGARGVGLSRAASSAVLVAVAQADGLHRLFEELGAIVVATTRELSDAIRSARADHVIVLPNDEAVRAEAVLIGAEADKAVTVLPATDPAQGLSAAVAYGDARTVDENVEDMRAALAAVTTAGTDGDPVQAAAGLVQEGTEVLTVVCGSAVNQHQRDEIARTLHEAYPRVSIEVHDGGQARPRFLLAAE